LVVAQVDNVPAGWFVRRLNENRLDDLSAIPADEFDYDRPAEVDPDSRDPAKIIAFRVLEPEKLVELGELDRPLGTVILGSGGVS
jgi:hypothetical protein